MSNGLSSVAALARYPMGRFRALAGSRQGHGARRTRTAGGALGQYPQFVLACFLPASMTPARRRPARRRLWWRGDRAGVLGPLRDRGNPSLWCLRRRSTDKNHRALLPLALVVETSRHAFRATIDPLAADIIDRTSANLKSRGIARSQREHDKSRGDDDGFAHESLPPVDRHSPEDLTS